MGAPERAQKWARRFHHHLRKLRVLDPACGTGNFLYIALELIKGLETEVLETLVQLGAPELLTLEMVNPRQFLGLEVNPRAAVIAELVLWIGFLQIHYRTHAGHPAEPILEAYETVQISDAVLTWDGYPFPGVAIERRAPRRGAAEPAPAAVAGGGLHRRQPAVHGRQGPARSPGRPLRPKPCGPPTRR